MLSFAKSHRTNNNIHLIKFEKEKAEIKGLIAKNTGEYNISLTLLKKGKTAYINGLEQKKLSHFLGNFNVVLFAPEDLMIIKGVPQIRRKFLDMEIGQTSRNYLYELNQYTKILQQRNTLLKKITNNKNDNTNLVLLDILTKQLIEKSIKIIRERIDFLFFLQKKAEEVILYLSKQIEKIQIEYQPAFFNNNEFNINNLHLSYEKQYEKNKQKEIEKGVTLIGPHRDDFIIIVNQKNVHKYGSQGQQRTAILAIKLAELELIYNKTGEYPVLLLDDVFSELDKMRQNALLSYIQGKIQTFITSTEVEIIDSQIIKEANIFFINDGVLQ